MNQTNNPKLKRNAQKLRREMTKEERHLWYDFLKTLPVTVNRQKVIGSYIVDFYCAEAKLIIEVDGSQHFGEQGLAYDEERSNYLRSLGLTILRFTNGEIDHHFKDVCLIIEKAIPHSSNPKSLPL